MNLADELELAIGVARGAARIVLEQFGRVERLVKTNPSAQQEAVTEADRAAQRYIVEALRARFGTDGFVGEESDTGATHTFECPDPMGRVWVIDPIDGTNNFIAGLENFAVCIGRLERGMPVLGVVLDVCRDQVYSAAAGQGAWRDGSRISAPASALSDSSVIMMTANLIDAQGRTPAFALRWIGQTHWKIRVLGSAALEAVAVAAGVAHGAITVNGKLWDCAAPAAIVLEAGGRVTDFAGRGIFPFDLSRYGGTKVPFLAAGRGAQGQLLGEIRRT